MSEDANIMTPDTDVPVGCGAHTGNELVAGVTPEVLRSNDIKIVKVGKTGSNMFVTVMGPTMESVTEGAARSLAYAERLKHGFENAGIEHAGIMFSVDIPKVIELGAVALDQIPRDRIKYVDRKDIGFCAVYKLTRGI